MVCRLFGVKSLSEPMLAYLAIGMTFQGNLNKKFDIFMQQKEFENDC